MIPVATNRELRLPFAGSVPSQSYLDYALPLSCLAGLPAHRPVFYTYNVQTFFPDSLNGLSEPKLHKFMMYPGLNNWQWQHAGLLSVERFAEFEQHRPDDREMLKWLREMLQSGYYIETRLNEYYLRSRPHFFGKHHALHINLVVGMSGDDATVEIAGHGDSYGVSSVPAHEFVASFFNEPSERPRLRPEATRTHRIVWLWRPCDRDEQPELDRARVAEQLADYMRGVSSRDRRIIAHDDHLAFPDDRGTWGSRAYASWRFYLGRLQRRATRVDLRATRTFWEHKQIMVNRLAHLARRGVRIPDRLQGEFVDIAALAKTFRLQAFLHRSNGHQAALAIMGELLETIENREREAWPRLYDTVTRSPSP